MASFQMVGVALVHVVLWIITVGLVAWLFRWVLRIVRRVSRLLLQHLLRIKKNWIKPYFSPL